MWEGSIPEFSNGVVVELVQQFFCPEVVSAASKLIARLLGMNMQRITPDVVHDKLRFCLMKTEEILKKAGAAMSEP